MNILRLAGMVCIWAFLVGPVRAEIDIAIGYLELFVPPPPVLSNLEEVPEDLGLAGAQLAIQDNATTGKFLKHAYQLNARVEDNEAAFLEAAQDLLRQSPFLVVHAPEALLVKLSASEAAQSALLFNASARDNGLRSEACAANLLHTIPSRSMLSDALAQFAFKKRWSDWVMIAGDKPGDAAFAQAIKRSAKKFRLKLLAEKTWTFDADMRRSAASEVPLFTQDFPEHDLLIVADEIGDFGRYIPFNTWLATPVAGSEGLVASAWSSSVEQHGAAQLQSRFRKIANRAMQSIDYAAWAAVRSIGEAVTRTNSGELDQIRRFILSEKFQLAGFKGRKLTYRSWNGQLRQPIPLTHPRAVVALAPLEGFLHQRNELDTLGLDRPESACSAFGGE